ncbi:MAG: tRNA lysidine(34) synthetase TilS [Sulfurimonas sp.]|uniref:tRNA lysidine(34) synthetase TilS n=1 Tax=Sulfurimonas sp. TaxID=2022749 RepID=UPI0025FBE9C0|nr:tRNA lysidine(34) synthetase TilS [Sulfurimonas sp.]MCK9491124.1 tRNA lysidine(34) synthetase TilS [Sulfurimonas sp.]
MLEHTCLDQLRGKKNLLAFSGGVDSSALFFLLLGEEIEFDIAIVNYKQRAQSEQEVSYAKDLAFNHNLLCHTFISPTIKSNFEAKAREIRYDFFDTLIKKYSYENLLTAHHLGDRFEWMLMQFCRGAGCAEMAGMQKLQKRDSYTLVRPLLHLDKSELYNYLKKNNIKYFEDATNEDEEIKRNSFRHRHTNILLDEYLSGIKKSFEYLDGDREILVPEVEIEHIEELSYFKSTKNTRSDIFIVDKILKKKSYMLSSSERELLLTESSLVVGREFLVSFSNEFVFILPYLDATMTKEFKEECRILRVDPKMRPYLYKNRETFTKVKELLL